VGGRRALRMRDGSARTQNYKSHRLSVSLSPGKATNKGAGASNSGLDRRAPVRLNLKSAELVKQTEKHEHT
jgi:hypothetical protein